MPLALDASTERPRMLCWDPALPEDWEEAKRRIEEHCARGFKPKHAMDIEAMRELGEITLEPPQRSPHHILFRILDQSGDTRLVWDRRMKAEVKEAYQRFKDLLSNGYTAFAVRRDGKRGSKLTEFDPLHEEILMVPDTMPG